MDFLGIGIALIILLFSSILHEIMHGLVAERLGDPTARLLGRITLDPRKHIDPMMSIALPLLLLLSGSPIIFGAAKPVPVDPFNLKEGRKDMALVALSGPMTNLILALAASLLFKIAIHTAAANTVLPDLLVLITQMNLLLAIFNLLPIPPLDGSKVFSMILPESLASQYLSIGSMGMLLLFFLLLFPGIGLGNLIFNLLNFSMRLLGM